MYNKENYSTKCRPTLFYLADLAYRLLNWSWMMCRLMIVNSNFRKAVFKQ